MPKRLFTLLVGINDYPHLNPLLGCVADVNAIETLILSKFASLNPQVVSLKNEQATRENIIHHFREHLGKAQDGDSVYFHFSGHGSQEPAPPELNHLNPNQKNETLVCYDSRKGIGWDLADKELAFLLWEISQKKSQVHIVVTLDCCHSGSGTRFKTGTSRQAAQEGKARTLADFLGPARSQESYFERQMHQGQEKVSVPLVPHILLSASAPWQKAWETLDNRGAFSTALLESLGKSDFTPSYDQLFSDIRIRVPQLVLGQRQDPQLESYLGFDSFSTFLEGKAGKRGETLKVYYQVGQWLLNIGALQGLNPQFEYGEDAHLSVFDDQDNRLGLARLLIVKPEHSILKLEFEADIEKIYPAQFSNYPGKPVLFFFKGEAAGLDQLRNVLQAPGHFLIREADLENSDFIVEAKADIFYLLPSEAPTPIQGVKVASIRKNEYAPQRMAQFIEVMKHLARWQNFFHLQNRRPQLNPDLIDFRFFEIRENEEEILHPSPEIRLSSYFKEGNWQPITYRLEIENNSLQPLFFHMFFLTARYGILWGNGKRLEAGQSSALMHQDLEKDLIGFLPQETQKEITLKIKLLVSTEEIDRYIFEQESLEMGKVLDDRFLSAEGLNKESFQAVKDDWLSKDLLIHIVKQEAKIQEKDTQLAQGKVKIKGHPQLKANVNLSPLSLTGRSAEPLTALVQDWQGLGKLVDFGQGSRSSLAECILEISEIQGEISEGNPLEIELESPLGEDEFLLPVALQDGFIWPLGVSSPLEGNRQEIRISQLPNSGETASRSIGKALKMLFFKMVWDRRGRDNAGLKALVIPEEGEIRYNQLEVKELIEQLEKEKSHLHILLLVHGIIGDSLNNARAMGDLLRESSYDLVLAFDYENLNTSLNQTSENLKTRLREAGIDERVKAGSLELEILAHSMGGLIARHYIERNHGKYTVKRLILMGTPSGGTVFAEIPDYIDFTTKALLLAANYFNPYIVSVAGLLWLLKKNKNWQITDTIFTTLREMAERSEFIEQLNNSKDPEIPYVIISGNIEAQSDLNFLEKLKTYASKILVESPNDWVVSIKSMQSLGSFAQLSLEEVACHHLNYFSSEEGWKKLREVLGKGSSEDA